MDFLVGGIGLFVSAMGLAIAWNSRLNDPPTVDASDASEILLGHSRWNNRELDAGLTLGFAVFDRSGTFISRIDAVKWKLLGIAMFLGGIVLIGSALHIVSDKQLAWMGTAFVDWTHPGVLAGHSHIHHLQQ